MNSERCDTGSASPFAARQLTFATSALVVPVYPAIAASASLRYLLDNRDRWAHDMRAIGQQQHKAETRRCPYQGTTLFRLSTRRFDGTAFHDYPDGNSAP